ncbi:MAG: response regulator transcription factor [Stenotrophomonas maltophilia]|jgi:DNA-binding response OmpR family regulator
MRLAIIEDDPEIMEVVSIAFETAWPGSQIVSAPNAVEGLELVKNETPDVVILDVALPEGDSSGFDLCKEIRTFSEVPIIMVTARTREVDIVRGLELGAADYLTKPFSSVELLARTRAVLRRVQVGPLGAQTHPFISKELSVDYDNREVLVHGEPVKLTPTEYKMLCYLVRNPRQVLTNQAILDEVWGQEYRNSNGLVKAHVQRLRKKLKDNLQDPRLIITERGRGYRFAGAN